jgi:hypothetical protein
MAKLIKKELNIYYEYYEVDLTPEQLELYNTDKDKFFDEFIWCDKFPTLVDNPVEKRYVDSTKTEYYLDSEDEPNFS